MWFCLCVCLLSLHNVCKLRLVLSSLTLLIGPTSTSRFTASRYGSIDSTLCSKSFGPMSTSLRWRSIIYTIIRTSKCPSKRKKIKKKKKIFIISFLSWPELGCKSNILRGWGAGVRKRGGCWHFLVFEVSELEHMRATNNSRYPRGRGANLIYWGKTFSCFKSKESRLGGLEGFKNPVWVGNKVRPPGPISWTYMYM